MSDDTNRDKLAKIIQGYFMWPEGSTGGDLAGIILADWLPAVLATVRAQAAAEQREKDIAALVPLFDAEWDDTQDTHTPVYLAYLKAERAIRKQGTNE